MGDDGGGGGGVYFVPWFSPEIITATAGDVSRTEYGTDLNMYIIFNTEPALEAGDQSGECW